MGRVLCLLVCVSGACTVGLPAIASDATQPQFTHNSWTSADGVPGMVSALAQTPDGYLWLGTYEGLYRFDGVTFERIPPAAGHPAGAIPATAVFATRGGELWVGYAGRGGIEVYRGGHLVRIPMPRAPGEVTGFAEDRAGGIYAIGGREPGALYRYWRGAWQHVDKHWGLPSETIWSVFSARDGTVWIATAKHLFFLRPGAVRFEDTGETLVDGAGFAQDPHGDIWISGPFGTRMVADYPHGQRRPRSSAFYSAMAPVSRVAMLFDHDGALWGSTYTGGLFRINAPGRDPPGDTSVQRFRTSDGLTSNQAVTILQDRESNIWAATENGLDQFRRANIEQAAMPPQTTAHGYRMAVDTAGTVYVASGETLYRARAGEEPATTRTVSLVNAICSDPGGGIWIAVAGRMERLRDQQLVDTRPVAGSQPVTGCGVDRSGRLWLAQPGVGVLLFDHGGWRHLPLPAGGQRPKDIIIDRAGNPVVLFSNRAVALVAPSGTSRLLDSDTLGVSGITGVFPTDFGLIVAGGIGMTLWDGRAFHRLSIDQYPWLRGVRGLAQTATGETWMLNNKGIHRVATALLKTAFGHPRTPLPHLTLDQQDGLTSHPTGEEGIQAATAIDGRIWFITRQGAVRVNPRNLVSNPLAPPVMIRGLSVNGRHYADPTDVVLPAGTRNISIDYTALSLSVPSRVAFRYRLEGVDATWVDPGVRREAFYTNLGPGSYRFQVIASNNTGLWNTQGAELQVRIPPTFLQSPIFYALCVLFAFLLLWVLYDLRVRVVSRRMRMRAATRTNERERIARELHDTLLQGIQALMLRFHVAAQSVQAADTRRALDAALERAEDVLLEGRERVHDLRAFDGNDDLEEVILALIDQQEFAPNVKVSLVVKGKARSVERAAITEVSAIAGEALFNVRRHANARQVTVELTFTLWAVTIAICDDGVGIPFAILNAGGRAGHFGLAGMRERAQQLGARFSIRSAAGQGTDVRFAIPARVAYKPDHRRFWLTTLMSRKSGRD